MKTTKNKLLTRLNTRLDPPLSGALKAYLETSDQSGADVGRLALRVFLQDESTLHDRQRQQAEVIVAAINTAMSAVVPVLERQVARALEGVHAIAAENTDLHARVMAVADERLELVEHLLAEVFDGLNQLRTASGQAPLPTLPPATNVRPMKKKQDELPPSELSHEERMAALVRIVEQNKKPPHQ